MALMKCSECGNELNNEDIVCAKCGCLVEENGNNSNDSSKKEVESCISETEKKNNSDIKTTNKRKMVSCAIVLILLVWIIIYISSDYWKYSIAKGYYEKENYIEAAERFKKLDDYKDSKELCHTADHKVAVMNDKEPPIISMSSKKIDIKQGDEFRVSEWLIDNNVTANDDIIL